ncbi:MAG TPA: B12-binding domain-containing radical SAM protein, partial [Acidobacteriota bacterium]
FVKSNLPVPQVLNGIKRRYGRFGISPEEFRTKLSSMQKPDAILVTSGMTYWYPGVQETIREAKNIFPDVELILGGIYATLMPEHARLHSGADQVINGQFENGIIKLVTGSQGKLYSKNEFPYPSWHLTGQNKYRVIMTSRGCPYRCTFCASDILNADIFARRNPEDVIREIESYYHNENVMNIVFYDDALLIGHKQHLQPILRSVIERQIKVAFHTPNGLNAREIDEQLSELMFESSFRTIRLSLESVNPEIQKVQGNKKVNNALFRRAINNLYAAGYKPGDIECYLILGLPNQTPRDVRDSLEFVADLGVIARLAVFSPIPGTAEAESARKIIGDAFLYEPLLQNHSVFPLKDRSMTDDDLQQLKLECKNNNDRIVDSAFVRLQNGFQSIKLNY